MMVMIGIFNQDAGLFIMEVRRSEHYDGSWEFMDYFFPTEKAAFGELQQIYTRAQK